jgi:hypothetical protein
VAYVLASVGNTRLKQSSFFENAGRKKFLLDVCKPEWVCNETLFVGLIKILM